MFTHGLAVVLVLAPFGAMAAPVVTGGPLLRLPDAKSDESPQGVAFRAGVQALLLEKGKPSVARGHFERALKIDGRYVPAVLGMAAVAQAEGRSSQVESWLQQAEKLEPGAPEVHLAWGRYHQGQGRLAQAEKSFLQARERAPRTIPPLLELGDLYLKSPHHRKQALEAFRAAVELAPANGHAQFGLGAAAAANGEREMALAALDKASNLEPRDPEPPRLIGRLWLEAGRFDEALAAFDGALKRQPAYLPAMLDRVDALAAQRRWPLALEQLAQARRIAPKAAAVALKFADVHQASGQFVAAKAEYLKAIELGPRDPLAYNNLAWMTVESKGDARQAVAWARQAVALAPGSAPFHDTLGWALRAAGDLPAASASLAKAVEMEPNMAGYHFHLGVIKAELKQPAAARAALEKALALDPKLSQSNEARALLKTL
ncbi:MAG TPA: tetratricopeptide repeat protein [Roseateles sp.]